MGSWTWLSRYAFVLLGAAILGTGIAELAVFKQTTLGTPKLPAAAVARFLGYGGALLILWMLAQRSARQIRRAQNAAARVASLILPLATLLALSAGYDIALALLRPFLTASLRDTYNWIFVGGITASALWLLLTLYRHAEGFFELAKAMSSRSQPSRNCPQCEASLTASAKFCSTCGTAVGS